VSPSIPLNVSKYLIKNVTVAKQTQAQAEPARWLGVEQGVLQGIGSKADWNESEWPIVIEGDGMTLLPAGVDPQVHMRVPGQKQKETADSCLHAAIHGGISALLTMPNTKPVIDCVQVLAQGRAEVARAQHGLPVEVLFSAALTKGQRGRELVDFASLVQSGVRFFTDDGVGVADDALMSQIFAQSHALGFTVLQHAEVPGHGGILAPSSVQEHLAVTSYDEEVEVAMVVRDLKLLARYPKAKYHVLHVSSVRTLEPITVAKAQGLQVTCEVSPHHLFLTGDDIRIDNPAYKMNPPLRSEHDRAGLIAGLQSGLVDFVATDHAPHESEVKGQFKTAAFGTTGLDSALVILWELYLRGQLSLPRLCDVFASAPANFLGIGDQHGSIEVARTFRAVMLKTLETGKPWEVSDLHGLAKNSCFLNIPLRGRVAQTFLGCDTWKFASP
jgi:dihydroorotase